MKKENEIWDWEGIINYITNEHIEAIKEDREPIIPPDEEINEIIKKQD